MFHATSWSTVIILDLTILKILCSSNHVFFFFTFYISTNKIQLLKYNKTNHKTHLVSGTNSYVYIYIYFFFTKVPSLGSLVTTKDHTSNTYCKRLASEVGIGLKILCGNWVSWGWHSGGAICRSWYLIWQVLYDGFYCILMSEFFDVQVNVHHDKFL